MDKATLKPVENVSISTPSRSKTVVFALPTANCHINFSRAPCSCWSCCRARFQPSSKLSLLHSVLTFKLNAGQPPMHSLVASRAKGLRTPLFPMTQSIKQSSINQIKIKQTPSFCGALFLAPRLGPCISPPSTLLCATVEGEIAPVGLFRAVLCNSLGLPIIL